MLTVPEAAKRATCDPETVRRWIRAGKLRARKVGTQHVIDEGDLDELMGVRATSRAVWVAAAGPRPAHEVHEVHESSAPYLAAPMRIWPATPTGIDLWLTHIVGRIVRAMDPVRIVLFGSRARGDQRPDSDYDLLVVMDHVEDRRAARLEIRRLLDDLPISKDVIVAPVAAIDDPTNPPSGVLYWALQDGKTIYERP